MSTELWATLYFNYCIQLFFNAGINIFISRYHLFLRIAIQFLELSKNTLNEKTRKAITEGNVNCNQVFHIMLFH